MEPLKKLPADDLEANLAAFFNRHGYKADASAIYTRFVNNSMTSEDVYYILRYYITEYTYDMETGLQGIPAYREGCDLLDKALSDNPDEAGPHIQAVAYKLLIGFIKLVGVFSNLTRTANNDDFDGQVLRMMVTVLQMQTRDIMSVSEYKDIDSSVIVESNLRQVAYAIGALSIILESNDSLLPMCSDIFQYFLESVDHITKGTELEKSVIKPISNNVLMRYLQLKGMKRDKSTILN